MTKSYLERCIAAKANIDVGHLQALNLGDVVGEPGSGYCFRRLGKLTLDASGREEYVGLKVPYMGEDNTRYRVLWEVAFISFIMGATPEFSKYVPSFMNLVSVEGDDALAILTEDVSEGGKHEVCSMNTNPEVREMLYKPLSHAGKMDEVLNERVLARSLAFEVGDAQKLLDFVPPPVDRRFLRNTAFDAIRELVYDALDDLTLVVPPDSVLGMALLDA